MNAHLPKSFIFRIASFSGLITTLGLVASLCLANIAACRADTPSPAPTAAPATLFDTAFQLQAKGKYPQAVLIYDNVARDLSLRSYWPNAGFQAAECLSAQKRFGLAVARYETIASSYPSDPIAPEAIWRALTLSSGPLNKRGEAIRLAQQLSVTYRQNPYGERGAYALGVLYYWNEKPGEAQQALSRYLDNYRGGIYIPAVHALLTKIGQN